MRFNISSFYERTNYLIFPVAYSLNMFSITALLIALGLFGEAEIAADVGIIQAAAVLVFMAFGSNARNIILSKNDTISIQHFFKFRCLLLTPLAILAYFLSKGIIDIANEFIFLLLFRKCVEWIVELQISERECENDKRYAYLYSSIQVAMFLCILISLYTGTENYIVLTLFVWAVSPSFQIIPFFEFMLRNGQGTNMPWTQFISHLGSSYIISISTYVFRVLIILLAGKALGGLLFSAYAIGGMINSVYTYALGPTLAAKSNQNNDNRNSSSMRLILTALMSLGLFIALLSYGTSSGLSETQFYFLSIGLSLIGSGIMLLAQRKRIHILQHDLDSVFVPDVLANILIIATVPFAFYLLGSEILSALFLWNAILNYLIYLVPSINYKWQENSKMKMPKNSLFRHLKRSNIQVIVLLFLIIPIFFQLNSNIIFDSAEMLFDSAGKLTNLPLPISIFACFLGLVFLINYKRCYTSAIFVFAYFVAMLSSIILTSSENSPGELGKIILMIQFILPVFALFLGQSYVVPVSKKHCFETIFLFVLMIIIPLEVIATLIQATGILTPYLYVFSLYQHLQYMPAIYIGLYFLAIFSLFEHFSARILILILAPFIAVYAVLSFSTSAMIIMFLGVVFSFILLCINKRLSFAFILTALVGIFLYGAMNLEKLKIYENQAVNNTYLQHKHAYLENKKILNPLVAVWHVFASMDIELYRKGRNAFENRDYKTAYDLNLKNAKRLGINADFSMYLLGRMYEGGLYLEQDNEKALAWYKKSAENGGASAYFRLGELYSEGKIVTKDYKKAIILYTKAAEMNHPKAQFKLSRLNEDGKAAAELNIEDFNYYDGMNQKAATEAKSIFNSSEIKTKNNVDVRRVIWGHYLSGINLNTVELLFGHEKRMDRAFAASAHNYYLDILYNFGLVSLLPVLILILYTIISVFKQRHSFLTSPRNLALVALVFYFIFVDNSLKVGFRQPYPGILMFFLWGVLLTNLQQQQSNYKKYKLIK